MGLSALLSKLSFYRILSQIDGFENPPLKIDGFGRTHWTYAEEAPELCNATSLTGIEHM